MGSDKGKDPHNETHNVGFDINAMATLAYADVPPLGVTVVDPTGKVAYHGRDHSGRHVHHGRLHGGEYTVLLNSDGLPSGNYAVMVSSGRHKVLAEALPHEKFARSGIAMKVQVRDDGNIVGQVSSGNVGEGVAVNKGSARIKIVNGKRWFLVKGPTGSQLGEHWVEEGTPEARSMGAYERQAIQNLQEKAKGSPNDGWSALKGRELILDIRAARFTGHR